MKPLPIETDQENIRAKEIEDQRKHVEQMKLVRAEIEQLLKDQNRGKEK